MKRLRFKGSLALSLFAFAMACAEKKDFSGGTKIASSEAVPAGGEPQEPTQGQPEPEKLFKDCNASTAPFVADVYKLPEGTKYMPDLEGNTPIKKICLNQLDITDREFSEGFPGVDNLFEYFALDFLFYVQIEKEGNYKFTLTSDDGAILFIDDSATPAVDNDRGLEGHAVSSDVGTVGLSKGKHKFKIKYYQGPRFNIALELKWTPPGESTDSYISEKLVSRK